MSRRFDLSGSWKGRDVTVFYEDDLDAPWGAGWFIEDVDTGRAVKVDSGELRSAVEDRAAARGAVNGLLRDMRDVLVTRMEAVDTIADAQDLYRDWSRWWALIEGGRQFADRSG